MMLRHFLPAVLGVVLAAVGFGMAFQGDLLGLLPTLLGCAAIVYASGIVQEYRSRIRGDHSATPAPPRPDADVAQYLNDGDRAWLMEHGDWTDPATRIVERPSSASDTLAADRKRRAEQVVSQMDSTDGWRTTRYADGRTVEHAVTDETPDMSEAKVKYLAGSSPARQQQTLNGDVLVVCPAGRYSGHDGPCRWFARVTDAQARRVRAGHLQASPQCAEALSGRTHTPDGDPWPPGAPTDVTRRGAYASDAPADDYERLARQMRRQAYIAHDVLGVERPT